MPGRSFLGSTVVLGGGGISVAIVQSGCKSSDRALRLCRSDIGLGQWVIIIHETVCRQWFGRAWVVWAVSWVAMSDSRLYRWQPPEVKRDSQSMLRS